MYYFLEIRDENNARELKAFAYGEASDIVTIGRRHVVALNGAGGQYSFRLLGVQYIGQDTESDDAVRIGAAIADGDTISVLLKRKLAALKKASTE